jgi:adenosine deaminase
MSHFMSGAASKLEVCQALPKAELHVHLEGSLSDQFWSSYDTSVLESIGDFRSSQDRSLPRFLVCMEKIHRSLNSPEIYAEAFADLVKSLIQDNVAYAEITWAPGAMLEFHKTNPADVYACIAEVMLQSERQIQTELLIDLIRNQALDISAEVVSWLESDRPNRVVGVNIGGNEARFPIAPMVTLLDRARELGLGVSIHAGESTDEEQLLSAISAARPERVGHAVKLQSDYGLGEVLRSNVHIEACPSSNVSLGYLKNSCDHPLLVRPELRGSINTDDRSFFSSTLSEEIASLCEQGCISLADAARFQLFAVEDAFGPVGPGKLAEISNSWSRFV